MCGVSHAAPKTHFANKKEFEEAIKSHVAKEFADAMQKIVYGNKDPHKMIQEFGLAYIQYFIDHPDSFMLLLNQKDIEIRASAEHIYDSDYAAFQIFQTHAAKLLLQSGVSEKYIPRQIISLWAIVTGLSALTVMHGFLFEGDWLAMATSILTGCDN
jgi:AcrR family transcriptional regulator